MDAWSTCWYDKTKLDLYRDFMLQKVICWSILFILSSCVSAEDCNKREGSAVDVPKVQLKCLNELSKCSSEKAHLKFEFDRLYDSESLKVVRVTVSLPSSIFEEVWSSITYEAKIETDSNTNKPYSASLFYDLESGSEVVVQGIYRSEACNALYISKTFVLEQSGVKEY